MPTFLFTDIENSTRLWDVHRQQMAEALKKHDELVYRLIPEFGGKVIEHTGDGVYAVFESGHPLAAMFALQQEIAEANWGAIEELRVRIGLHACPADQEGLNYFHEGDTYHGPAINHTARVMSAGWGGQILLTPDVLHFDQLPEGAELHDLGEHMLKGLTLPQPILSMTHPDLPWQEFPPLNTLSARPNNLPLQTTPFIGRQQELRQLMERCREGQCRLLTMYGPGGVGKTRLAIQTAAELVNKFSHGVFFVPLASITNPEHIVPAIARAISFSFHGSQNQKLQLLNYLRNKQMLLLIDNFEHLLEGVGLINDILEAAPNVQLLVTCRERLNMADEKVLKLGGMPIPGEDDIEDLESFSAVQLFLSVVHRTQPEFKPDESDALAIARICRLVDGMPLGIELAAAWVRIFSCADIADKIERNLDFLDSEHPEISQRQRSLYAVCDYFWSQLNWHEKKTLCQLALFRGGFHRRAAAAVADASTFFLSALVDRAFLSKVTISSFAGSESLDQGEKWRVRYLIHELLRQYAAAKLEQHPEERAAARTRHGRYYADFLHYREPFLKNDEQQATLEQIQAEIDNIRTAWQWVIEQEQIDLLSKMLESTYISYNLLGQREEGYEMLAQVAEKWADLLDQRPSLQVRLLIRRGRLLERMSRSAEGQRLSEQGIALAKEHNLPLEVAHGLRSLGMMHRRRGQYEEAIALLEQALAIYRQHDEDWYLANGLTQLSDSYYRLGQFQEARRHYWESYNLHRRLGDPHNTASTLNGLGVLLDRLGEQEAAATLLQESIKLNRMINNRWGIAVASQNLGSIAYYRSDYMTARPYFKRSLAYFRESSNQWTISAALSALGIVIYKLGEREKARAYLREALALTQAHQIWPILLDILVQTAVIAHQEKKAEQALTLLAFALAQPGLDQAETGTQARQLWSEIVKEVPPTLADQIEKEVAQKSLSQLADLAEQLLA